MIGMLPDEAYSPGYRQWEALNHDEHLPACGKCGEDCTADCGCICCETAASGDALCKSCCHDAGPCGESWCLACNGRAAA